MQESNQSKIAQFHKGMLASFSLSELRTLCLEIQVNYDTLGGGELGGKVRELIIQMVHNGRLSDLQKTVEEKRPHINWPDIRNTQLPSDWEVATERTTVSIRGSTIGSVVGSGNITAKNIAGRDIVDQSKKFIINLISLKILFFITCVLGISFFVFTYGSDMYHWFSFKANNDEILVLLTDFRDDSDNVTYDAAGSIEIALMDALARHNLNNVRLVRINESFQRNEVEAVKTLGKRYNATFVIWGHYDDSGMFPRFTILQDNRMETSPENPEDQLINLASPPDDFTLYVNRDLPELMTYFTQFTVGQILFQEDAIYDALVMYEDALKIAEGIDDDLIQNSLATIYSHIGFASLLVQETESAMMAYSIAITLSPEHAEWYGNRAATFLVSGDIIQAISDYDEAIKLDPNSASYYSDRGAAYLADGNLEQALFDLNKAIELNPDDPITYYNRGKAYYALGNLEQALEDFNKVIAIDPNYPSVHNERAFIYEDYGDNAQALNNYNREIELNPDDSIAYYNRATIYLLQ